MTASFALLAGLTLGAAIAAVTLRNLVHAALCLALCLTGMGLIFIHLEAEFAGLVQILVYVGAVAILIVFAILLVRGTEPANLRVGPAPWLGGIVVVAVAALLFFAVSRSPTVRGPVRPAPAVSVRSIGERLMREEVVPLEAVGLLLTAATLGAALIALPRSSPVARPGNPSPP